ncbi:hypothetical protein COU56_01615 [Candidatus Pacearchaeota archaeon CG10_big_fil_rev_8_21_14_0_10_31_9]|nr:MAG: hypothetical protein AUJ62_01025 [Candidatus Pacearchaeota archaeon CG1_02_32_21]PIN95428.1 MAG: hypothetical protein COU56_01615 [Candidatus Pacearchaeota archaeon CG10_big_fil_rev_8_21_14_0_10_31_9]PIZ82442.1 MAG: hypothetical protein COX97_04770 [Candidatus Pacearchaeota archaeon CG_4_10_14_0_2_um_filter_05_32_18]
MKKGGILSIIGFVLIILSIILYSLDLIFFFFGPTIFLSPNFIYPSLIIFIFGLIFGYIFCFVNILRLKSGWPRKLSKVGALISILIIFVISIILLVKEYSSKGLLSAFFGPLFAVILVVFGAVLLMVYDREKSKKVWKIISIIFGILFFVLILLVVIYSILFYAFLNSPQ